jgi:alkylation response protein AidB-like acyl-CoA dehydrogenase
MGDQTDATSATVHEVARFRAEVRAWLDSNAPARGSPDDFSAAHIVSATAREEFEAREHAALATTRAWQRRLHDAGWAARSWPEPYGGRGRPEWEAEVVAEEQAGYGVSTKMLAIALEMVPPVLVRHGTEEQRLEHLPRIARGDEAWCQLLSEPDAGSDLTNVQTHAAADPATGGWTVTGQKVWTSGATSADFALLLARTARDRPGRDGVSCFALRMDQPGVEVRPLRQMSGAYHFNEVFLDGARLEPGSLIGDLGGGFDVLRTMLASERAAIGGGTSARSFLNLRTMVAASGRGADPLVRQEVARAYSRERILDLLGERVSSIPAGGAVAKLAYSEHARLTASAALAVLGPGGQLTDDELGQQWVDRFLFAPGLRIGGGTDEIQRNTIAERGLRLPR